MAVSSGKLLAAGMLGLGLVASVLSISYRRGQTHRALALWGPEQATAVATAPVVMALWFDPPLAQFNEAMPSEVIGRASGQKPNVSGTYEIGTVRRLLFEDGSFDWQSEPPVEPLSWTYGLEFSGPMGPKVVILLDPTTGMVREVKNRKAARLRAGSAKQLRAFLQEQFASPEGASRAK